MANDVVVSPDGRRFGAQLPVLKGEQEFAAHDGAQTWTDSGEAEVMLTALAPEVRAYACEQVKYAVISYIKHAYLEGMPDDAYERYLISLDSSNDQAQMTADWDLGDHLHRNFQGLAQARNDRAAALLVKVLGNTIVQAIPLLEQAAMQGALQAAGQVMLQLQGSFRGAPGPAPRAPSQPVHGNLRNRRAQPGHSVRPAPGRAAPVTTHGRTHDHRAHQSLQALGAPEPNEGPA